MKCPVIIYYVAVKSDKPLSAEGDSIVQYDTGNKPNALFPPGHVKSIAYVAHKARHANRVHQEMLNIQMPMYSLGYH
jgi:hypothetical protein